MEYNFMRYVSEHGKMYGTVEDFNVRQTLYAEVDAFVNSVNEDPTSTYTSAHNKFSDWTQEEKDALLGLKNMPMPEFVYGDEDEEMNEDIPHNVDWRMINYVTPVKDQGSCGSCWAFSAIEAIESAWMIAGSDEQVIMSTQELVDCTNAEGNMGCNGGWYF